MSLPWNFIRPPTIFPMLDRSRMMPSDTVDLPQPDSPTMPIASPGMTVQEKSMTAGISPLRVKKEIDRFSISMIGASVGPFVGLPGFRTASFMGRSNPCSSGMPGRARHGSFPTSILHRLFAQRVGQEIEAEHERHQRDRRRQRRVDEGAQQTAGILDRRAPVGAF